MREVLVDAGALADRTAREALARELWDGASYREERGDGARRSSSKWRQDG